MRETAPPRSTQITCLAVFVTFALLSAGGCVTGKDRGGARDEAMQQTVAETAPASYDYEEDWGVRIKSLRHSAAGYMLDFRFHIVDPGKAEPLLDRKRKAYLIDQKTGAKLIVPRPPKIGSLRQKSSVPLAGRDYFILFANPGGFVKPGSKVTVVIGEARFEGLTVE